MSPIPSVGRGTDIIGVSVTLMGPQSPHQPGVEIRPGGRVSSEIVQCLVVKNSQGGHILFTEHPAILAAEDRSTLVLKLDHLDISPQNIQNIVLASLDLPPSFPSIGEILTEAAETLFPQARFVTSESSEQLVPPVISERLLTVPEGDDGYFLEPEVKLIAQQGRLTARLITDWGTLVFGGNEDLEGQAFRTLYPDTEEIRRNGLWVFFSLGSCLLAQVERDENGNLKTNNREVSLMWSGEPWPIETESLEIASARIFAARGIGRRRPEQQDSFLIRSFPHDRCMIVGIADGHGKLGDICSREALETLQHFLINFLLTQQNLTQEILQDAVKAAEQKVRSVEISQAKGKSYYDHSGTTLEVIIEQDEKLHLIHVGDCRTYRISPKKQTITRLTRDHGGNRRKTDLALSRTLGDADVKYKFAEVTAEPDLSTVDLESGESLLMVSDGLSILSDQQIYSLIVGRSPQEAVEILMRAVQPSARDNVTAIIWEKK